MNALSLLLARNGFLPAVNFTSSSAPQITALGTILASLASYGVAPNTDLMEKLKSLPRKDLADWWGKTETAIRNVVGADRNMDDFVVYKNFPAEVLEKSEAEYWLAQILMYMGAPNAWFTEAALPRPDLDERLTLKIMSEGNAAAVVHVRDSLMAQKAAWTEDMRADIMTLLDAGFIDVVSFETAGSRENAAWLAGIWYLRTQDANVIVNTPMDVLRIAAAWSGADAGLRVPGRLAPLPRWLRRKMITALTGFSQDRLEADFAMRAKSWKPLLHALHTGTVPGALGAATQAVRDGTITTFDGHVEKGIADRNREVLFLLQEKPGSFARRLHQLYPTFGRLAFEVFTDDKVLSALSNEQLLKLNGYFGTVNARKQFLYTPRGQMSKAQIADKTKSPIALADLDFLQEILTKRIGKRIDSAYPEGFNVDASAHDIGLLLNGQESGVGRGTVFDIPAGMTFLRSASFWKTGPSYGNIWFDNGWAFFDHKWNGIGGVSWDHERESRNGKVLGIFSGDPTNSKDLEGRACQMIDLYLDDLKRAGVAYALWSILSYNGMPFGDANDVLGTLQWGENPEKGKLYEPARAQITLPLSGPDKGKIVAMLDVNKRKLVFIDANLPMAVNSMMSNLTGLSQRMPALLATMKATPSAGDLFSLAKSGTIPVCFSEKEPVNGKGLVFKPVHPDSTITPLNVADILAMKD